jgi:hypothetical protein
MKSESRITRPVFWLLVALFSLVLPQPVSGAEQPVIKDLVVSNSTNALLLYCQVGEGFRPEMEEGVLNGIPVTFTFMVSLREVEGGRPGRQLAELTFDHTLSYDVLKEEFHLRLSENNTELTCGDLARAKMLMAEVSDARILALTALTPGREYFLSAKVKLERKTLPHFFHYLIPFWQLGDYESDWQYVQFKY